MQRSAAFNTSGPLFTRREALATLLTAASMRLAQPRSQTTLERTEALLRRIAEMNPGINAYVTVTAERARADARASDARRRRGMVQALEGVTVAHKDLFETAGIRTTAGSRLYDSHVPEHDATIVARLAAAGTVLLGKTNTHELGGGVTTINPFFGTTRNPRDRTRIAGGSSGGSAAAVAAGLADVATGSDTGGSVRIPAAFCGCVGFKPTYGRVSTAGLLGAAPTFDHSGIITRTVEDAEKAYRAIAGYDPADPESVMTPLSPRAAIDASMARLRIGIARNFFFERLQPDVARAIEDAIALFIKAKADVLDITFPIDEQTMSRVFDPIVVAEIHQRFARDWNERPSAFSPAFAGFFKAPLPSGLELAAAHRALREYQQAVRQLFEKVDIVVTPTVAITAPPIDGPIDGALILRNTWPFNAARTPTITIPCGVDAAGLPIGLQLAAAPFDDDTLLGVARGYQTATKWHLTGQ